ncbi:MAG: hypothetical protein LBS88_02765, partial [Tannerellaceae bacterium]|nr:hypothetical protein [Tannerellaceae bacterium]
MPLVFGAGGGDSTGDGKQGGRCSGAAKELVGGSDGAGIYPLYGGGGRHDIGILVHHQRIDAFFGGDVGGAGSDQIPAEEPFVAQGVAALEEDVVAAHIGDIAACKLEVAEGGEVAVGVVVARIAGDISQGEGALGALHL